MHLLIKIVSTILLIGIINFPALAADEETLARQAEQAGQYREALTHYVKTLQSVSESSPKDSELREKIIKLSQKIQPPPAVPEEARKYSVRGQTAIKNAKSNSDYIEAAQEFSKALRLAPWWAEAYFNLAIAQEKAGKFSEAILNLKYYIMVTPNAPDVEKVKDQIYALEYTQEKLQKQEQEAEKLRQEEIEKKVVWAKRVEFLKRMLEGNWSIAFCAPGRVAEGRPGGLGCNSREYSEGGHWWGIKTSDFKSDKLFQFVINSNGTAELSEPSIAQMAHAEKVIGVPIAYGDIRDIGWVCRFKDGGESSAWRTVENDNKGFVLSCDRPSGSYADPSVRYQYIYLQKR